MTETTARDREVLSSLLTRYLIHIIPNRSTTPLSVLD